MHSDLLHLTTQSRCILYSAGHRLHLISWYQTHTLEPSLTQKQYNIYIMAWPCQHRNISDIFHYRASAWSGSPGDNIYHMLLCVYSKKLSPLNFLLYSTCSTCVKTTIIIKSAGHTSWMQFLISYCCKFAMICRGNVLYLICSMLKPPTNVFGYIFVLFQTGWGYEKG